MNTLLGLMGPVNRSTFQEVQQSVGMRAQQLLAAQIADDAVTRTTVIPVGLDQTRLTIAFSDGHAYVVGRAGTP